MKKTVISFISLALIILTYSELSIGKSKDYLTKDEKRQQEEDRKLILEVKKYEVVRNLIIGRLYNLSNKEVHLGSYDVTFMCKLGSSINTLKAFFDDPDTSKVKAEGGYLSHNWILIEYDRYKDLKKSGKLSSLSGNMLKETKEGMVILSLGYKGQRSIQCMYPKSASSELIAYISLEKQLSSADNLGVSKVGL